MKITERELAVVLSEEGRHVLEFARIRVEPEAALAVYVEDADDLGLWARIPRKDGEHLILIRWEYVLTIDFPAARTRAVGLGT